ncbi:AbiJ-NTD4 domain-containing protein [Amorphus orientalis]|uniref:HEPN AbiJ-N-terminal domain-containing protein n=1 Tax=Amorphus orientalis TaxID=649198 RepID=A0AAE3VLA2_9HYPH|nr:hypothetical protein [Amorphus orientalis]MDQ0314105.1 hypothetical protein [Amorphus orientalis]
MGGDSSFSDRYGFRGPSAEITIREDAPASIRDGVLMLAYSLGLSPGAVRGAISNVLLIHPDPNNWSAGNIKSEVYSLIHNTNWYKVYDIAEQLWIEVGADDVTGEKQDAYAKRLNQLFREYGVGWEMKGGEITVRGAESFDLVTQEARSVMQDAEMPIAANEIHEALRDMSRRPEADLTGAVQHGMAALECVAREIGKTSDTLGSIIPNLKLTPPLDRALHKLWGFASQQGRHVREGGSLTFEDAELVVTVASAVSVYLIRRQSKAFNENLELE